MPSKIEMDLIGSFSPMDLLKCKRCLKTMKKGDILEVILADETVSNNLITIVNRSEDELIYKKKNQDTICLGIRKGTRI